MIYLVTQQILPSSDAYKIISVEESIAVLKKMNLIGLDTETQGLNPHLKKLLLLQLGNYDNQVVIDATTIDITFYKELIEDKSKGFIFWNADFDLKFLYKYNIIPYNIYDGYLAEKLFSLGLSPAHIFSLKYAANNYLGITLDKTVRGKIIWSKVLSEDIIKYSADDVKYLELIMNKQIVKIKRDNLSYAIITECSYVRVNAYMEYCGIKLNVGKWKEKMKKDQEELNKSKCELDSWVIKKFPNNNKYVKIDLQGDLFTGFDDKPKCSINWNSPKQIIPLLEELGFNLVVKDKKTGLMKKSIEANVINDQKDISDISSVYIKYKENQKVVSTYGQNFIDSINEKTERIHTAFNSIGTATSRVSSGGGYDLETKQGEKLSLINMQNIPSDEFTRSCFIPESGNKWISADYCGQESFLMASIANDKAMLNELINGSGDMHSLVAKLVFDEIPRDTPLKDIKEHYTELRKEAKRYEFLFFYGGTDFTIRRNFGLSVEKSKDIYTKFMNGFSGLKTYQEERRKEITKKDYILMSPISKYRSYMEDWDKMDEYKNEFTSAFWDSYKLIQKDPSGKRVPKSQEEREMCRKVSKYAKFKSTWEKHSINYPIQHAGAMCYKKACIYMFDYILENNLFMKVKFLIGAHDEINLEAPNDIAKSIADKLVEFMEKSGAEYCTRAKLSADVNIGDCWIH